LAAAAFLGGAFDVSAFAQGGKRVYGAGPGLDARQCGEGANIGPEGAAEQFLGGHNIAGLLMDGELLAVQKGSLEPQFLGCYDGLDGGFNFALVRLWLWSIMNATSGGRPSD
jgi:hypothetical protein